MEESQKVVTRLTIFLRRFIIIYRYDASISNKLYRVCSVGPYPFGGGVYVVIQYSSMLASWNCIFFMPERGQKSCLSTL